MGDMPGQVPGFPLSVERDPQFDEVLVLRIGVPRFRVAPASSAAGSEHLSVAIVTVDDGTATWSETDYLGLVVEHGEQVAHDIAAKLLAWSITTKEFPDRSSGDGYAVAFLLLDGALLTEQMR